MMELTALEGIGPKRCAAFHRLGIEQVSDLLLDLPLRYEDRQQVRRISDLENLAPGKVLLSGVLDHFGRLIRLPGKRSLQKARLFDGEDSIEVVWYNQPYVLRKLHPGHSFLLYGHYDPDQKQVTNPSIVDQNDKARLAEFTGLLPIYRLCEGLSQSIRRKAVRSALTQGLALLEEDLDPFSDAFLKASALHPLGTLLQWAHFPEASDRLFTLQEELDLRRALVDLLARGEERRQRAREKTATLRAYPLTPFLVRLPFTLTEPQRKALQTLQADLISARPMNRLLLGDVGSGKTVLVFALAYLVAQNGGQTAFMAPTEVLARQHYEKAQALFGPLHIPVYLLTGKSTKEELATFLERAKQTGPGLFIGTHSLFQERVTFSQLALVATDEQQRFGVIQRGRLAEKSLIPNLLVLSATPIPRTLHLVELGYLDLTQIEGRPPGRKKIETYVVDSSYEKRIFAFVEKLAQAGGQTYFVCPRIEKGEAQLAPWSVEAVAERARIYFQGRLSFGCMSGALSQAEKTQVMDDFRSGKTPLLISTTVIEVGVDVPQAVLMVVACAERFGLAQLHQLRGRVGRSERSAYCILLAERPTPTAKDRLQFLASHDEGLAIAQKDLALRGGGDPFGERQHGEREAGWYCYPDQERRSHAFQRAQALLDAYYGPGLLRGDGGAWAKLTPALRKAVGKRRASLQPIGFN